MSQPRFHLRALLFVSGLTLGSLLSTTWFVHATAIEADALEPVASTTLPLDMLQTFTQTFAHIKGFYVEDKTDEALIESALRGMVQDLDPHSSILSKNEYSELRDSIRGEFGGLGMEVTVDDGFLTVVSPIDDTPAANAGIQPGDMIIRLGDTPVRGLSLQQAIGLMRGKPGTELILSIMREGEEGPILVPLIRDVIKVSAVKSRLLEPSYGYVRITSFQTDTGNNLKKAIRAIQETPLKGLVLDLRNNPGGSLQAAVDVANVFLQDGMIVYIDGRAMQEREAFYAEGKDYLQQAPLVVLVNNGSASASEIVAGALQDQSRAVIMGQKTFGKGSVQTTHELNENWAIKLTTARYYTPNGRSIQALGIAPDVALSRLALRREENRSLEISEADLNQSLQAEQAATDNTSVDDNLAETDYAVSEALNLLKGLNVLERRVSR